MRRLRRLAPPIRYAVYVAGALLVFLATLGLGAAAALVVEWQSERAQTGYGGSAGSETLEDTASAGTTMGAAEVEATAASGSASSSASGSTLASEETMPEVTGPKGTGPEGTALEQTATTKDATSDERDAAFVHRATDENSRGDYTYIGDPAIDGDPNAVVLVSVSANREAAYGHNVGVWYEPGARKWAIFNQDRTAVPAGTTFRVVLPPASESFVHRAGPLNTAENATSLDDPLTNGKPGAILSVTQNWNPGGGAGVYNDHPVDVLYDEDVQKWAVYNRDGATIPEGASFNVGVSGRVESAG